MMTKPKPPAAEDRDPWLAAALRHAPDAADVPPAGLSEAIRRAAHDSAASVLAPRRDRPSSSALLRFWSWLTQPAVATAFTTLALATTIGVLWWGEATEPELARPTRPPPAAVTAAVPVPTPPAAESGTAAPPQAVPPQPAAAGAQQPAAAKDSERAPAFRPRGNSATAAAAAAAKAEAGALANVPRAAPTPVAPSSEQAASSDDARESTRAALPRTAPAPSAMPGRAADATAARAGRQAEAAASDNDEAAGAPSLATRSDAAATAGRPAPALAAPPAARRAESAAAPGVPAAVLSEPAALFADVRSQPQRWRWQVDGGPMRAVDERLLRWLAELERATPTWSAQAAVPGSAGAPAVLALLAVDDPSIALTIAIESDSAQARLAGGAAWWTLLRRHDAAALREALERLVR